jgi:tetratricopeptide (TPR) repeat protein
MAVTDLFDKVSALRKRRQFDEARSMIAAARESWPGVQLHELTALSALLEVDAGNFYHGLQLMREAIRQEPTWLPHWYRLCYLLMDQELWPEALEAADELISLSERCNESYFLDDARFRKALCLKALGRHVEIPSLKRNIAPDVVVFTAGRLYGLDDLD